MSSSFRRRRAVSTIIAAVMLIVGLVVGAGIMYVVAPSFIPPRVETNTVVSPITVQPNTDKFTLGVVATTTADFAAWQIAKNYSLFSQYLPNANLVEFANSGQMQQAFAAGTIDVGWGLTQDIMVAMDKGTGITVVSTMKIDHPLWVVAVNANSSYHTLQDLHGKSISTSSPGSGSYGVALYLFGQQGWKQGTDYTLANVGDLNTQIAAVQSGSVPAIVQGWATMSGLVEAGTFRIVANITLPFPHSVLAATKSFVTSHPQDINSTLSVLRLAFQVFNTQPNYVISLYQTSFNLKPNSAAQFYQMSAYTLEGTVFLSDLAAAQQFMIAGGSLNATQATDVTKDVTPGFAPIKA